MKESLIESRMGALRRRFRIGHGTTRCSESRSGPVSLHSCFLGHDAAGGTCNRKPNCERMSDEPVNKLREGFPTKDRREG